VWWTGKKKIKILNIVINLKCAKRKKEGKKKKEGKLNLE